MIDQKWKLLRLLCQPYSLEILSMLYKEPRRFVDLSDACPNERTRTNRLRVLEEAKLIETTPMKIKKRTFVHYRLTDKGKQIFEIIMKLEEPLK